MRLAFLLGRTERELMASLGSDELTDCLAFAAEYDLPDVFFGTGRVCTAFVESKISDHVPYYRQPSRAMTPATIAAKFAAAREIVKGAAAHQGPP